MKELSPYKASVVLKTPCNGYDPRKLSLTSAFTAVLQKHVKLLGKNHLANDTNIGGLSVPKL